MYNQGFLKVSAVTPNIQVGNIEHNKQAIMREIKNSKAGVLVFPELTLTGYTASDLFYQASFLKEAEEALITILKENTHPGIVVLGMPFDLYGVLYNVAVVIQQHKILGIVPKVYLPNHHEFYEKRWFKSGNAVATKVIRAFDQDVPFGHIIFIEEEKNIQIGVEICQDLWANQAPSDDLANAGANVILNLSASTEFIGKQALRRHAVLDHSRKQMTAYVYTTTGSFESVSEAVFSNHRLIAVQGELVIEDTKFHENESALSADLNITAINYQRRQDSNYRDHLKEKNEYIKVYFSLPETKAYQMERSIVTFPFIKQLEDVELAFELQVEALKNKLKSLPKNLQKVVIGVSGGLDSTLALVVAREAMKRMNKPTSDIIAVTMPSSATSDRTKSQALKLMELLEIEGITISIHDQLETHLASIKHVKKDVTYENAQARIRTLILMDLANQKGGIVLGTGDLSEIAMGFMTYNGDQMSMYAINAGIPKTMIYYLLEHYSMLYPKCAPVLKAIMETPISPELLKGQKTEDTIGRYDINDFILYHHLVSGMDESALIWYVEQAFELENEQARQYVERFIKRFYQSQFKRQTLPEGPKILAFSLSPRGEYRLPSDIRK